MSIICEGGVVNSINPFQGLGSGVNPTPSLQFLIKKIDHKTAKAWVEKWHYSHRIPTVKNISFGLFADEQLYAVIVYGIGVNPYQATFLNVKRVLEIKRMCRSEPRLNFPLSRFISISSKMVYKEFPFDCLIAFADPEQGHEGIVYKASGFVLHGKTNPEWHLIDKNGVKRHRRFAYRHSKRNKCSLKESREFLKVKRIQSLPKFRWIKKQRA